MTLIYILQVLIGFGFVIFIHEMGHFLAAKRVGVTCPAFSIGFPFPVWTPKGWKAFNIFKYTWRGTEYRLGWIPFGGYVTMQGQSDNPGQLEGAKEGDQSDYRNKSYWQKTQILLGGVTMNAITAVIGFIIAFQLGVTFIEPTVGLIQQQSGAWVQNEIQVGDKIITVNERDVVDFEDVMYAGIFDGGDSIRLVVEREENGETVRKNVTLGLDVDSTFGIKMPGIRAMHRVTLLEEEANLFPASLGDDRPRDGDEIISINGRAVRNAHDALGFIEQTTGEVTLTLRRGFNDDAREWTVPYTPRRSFFTSSSAYRADISTAPPPFVAEVRRDSAAERAGLRKGDRIIARELPDGSREVINSFGDVTRMVDESQGNPIKLVIKRGDAEQTLEVTPDGRESLPGRYQLGMNISTVDPKEASDAEIEKQAQEQQEELVAYGVRPGSAAEKQGLKPGDRIVGVRVGGRDYENPETGEVDVVAFQQALLAAAEGDTPAAITYQVERESGLASITVKPSVDGPDSGAYMMLETAELRSEPVTYGLVESVEQGFYHSKKVGYKIVMTLSGLFTGRVKIWHLGGPVVIAKRSYSLALWGAGTLIFFLAFISINLAIINLLPLPVLDGGQWLIVTIEAIRGKPLPERAMNIVGMASFIAVLGLMVFIMANDLVTVFIRKWV